jgi:hypothetical protein
MSKIADPNLVFVIPQSVISQTLEFLQWKGEREGHEGVVLWPARLLEGRCQIVKCLVPAQVTGQLRYRIPDDEVFRIICEVGTNGLVIPIQVHSHPRDAFHSEVDDERAFVQHTNGISIVLPDFAQFDSAEFFDRAVVYSLVSGDTWREVPAREVDQRFLVQED